MDVDMVENNPEQTMLGRWLKSARANRAQADVAARIEMDQAEWSKWETGRRRHPKPEQIRDFAFALGIPVESVALAYAGIWPGDRGTDRDAALLAERMRTMEIPPDVTYDELLLLRHLFRGIRGYESEAAAERSARVAPTETAAPGPADPSSGGPGDLARVVGGG